MNSIRRTVRMWAIATAAATAFLGQVQAAPVVTVSPATQNVGVGDPASVNILVSGLTEAVGGFSFVLDFNESFLSFVDYTFNLGNVLGAGPTDLSFGLIDASFLDVFILADVSATEAELEAAQGASFVLATVNFKGLASGLSPLILSNVALSMFDGITAIPGVAARNGEVCVGGNCTVPEPTSMLLVATALGALVLRRRKAA